MLVQRLLLYVLLSLTTTLAVPLNDTKLDPQTCNYIQDKGSTCASIPPPRPVFQPGFADPSLVKADGIWYSFATGGPAGNVAVVKSADNLTSWGFLRYDALPGPFPDWVDSKSPGVWAPDVTQLFDGSWLMYFAVQIAASSTQHCIDTARSKDVEGPYTVNEDVLFCPLLQLEQYQDTVLADYEIGNTTASGPPAGAIDPSAFVDPKDHKQYALYEIDKDGSNKRTGIMIQPVGRDGCSFESHHVQLLTDVEACDRGTVEAPSMVYFQGRYILFFSSGMWDADYTLSMATASSPMGPFTRRSEQILGRGKPWGAGSVATFCGGTVSTPAKDDGGQAGDSPYGNMATDFLNPGGASVVVECDELIVALHAGPGLNRHLRVVRLRFNGDPLSQGSVSMVYEQDGQIYEVNGL